MKRKFNQSQQGFTLIELMITIAIAGILLGVAVPSMRDMISDNRISSYTNEFVTSLYLTRSEAVKRGKRIAICKSTNGASCTAGGGWQVGWVIFEDDNNDGAFVAADVIQVREALATSVSLTSATGSFSFIGNGSTQAGSLTLTMDGKSRTISLSSVGRVNVGYP